MVFDGPHKATFPSISSRIIYFINPCARQLHFVITKQLRIRRAPRLFPFENFPLRFTHSFSLSLALSLSFLLSPICLLVRMSRSYSLTSTFSAPRHFSFFRDEFRHSTLKVISTITVFQTARWELQLTSVFSRLLYTGPLCLHAAAHTYMRTSAPGSGSDANTDAGWRYTSETVR